MRPSNSSRRRLWLCAVLSVAAVVAAVLLLPDGLYLSSAQWDLPQFVAWRSFAADNIRAGHLPLWNPYSYSGEPFLGDYISAELYPPNVIFLFLPLARAFNLSLLLHLLLLGWGVYYWAGRRGNHPAAAALAGLAAMLGGPVFMRLPTGQVGHLCAMAWAPWMFCALEAAWRGPALRPVLLAAMCACLQVLGGHPQYAFFVAIAAGLHAIVHSVADPVIRRRAWWVAAAAYGGGALLAAAQILPGLAATAESVRQGRMDYDFVRMASFPPENLLTILAPGFFGHLRLADYWGRVFLWDGCLFVGASGVALAALALADRERGGPARRDLLMALLLLVFALGDHTPLQHLLYDYVPGFGQLRGFAKFTFPMFLFVALAIGAGADQLIRRRFVGRWLGGGLAGIGLLALAAGVFLWARPAHLTALFDFVQKNHEHYSSPLVENPDAVYIALSGVLAGRTLALGGVMLALAGVLLALAHRRPVWGWALLALLPGELLVFAGNNFATATMEDLAPKDVRQFFATLPKDGYRVLNPAWMDGGYLFRAPAMWDDNPSVLKRYAEFIFMSQGFVPDQANQYVLIERAPPIFSLLRFQYVLTRAALRGYKVRYNPNPLPRALLLTDYQVRPTRDAIFSEIFKPDFDPRKTVFLEREPNPAPQGQAPGGTVTVVEDNGDRLTVEADTPAPTLLLITDLYSRDWRARALPGSAQQHYEILPADYIVRAIPLSAGHHHLVVEYAPLSFSLGLAISGLAWVAWAGLFMFATRRERKDASV